MEERIRNKLEREEKGLSKQNSSVVSRVLEFLGGESKPNSSMFKDSKRTKEMALSYLAETEKVLFGFEKQLEGDKGDWIYKLKVFHLPS